MSNREEKINNVCIFFNEELHAYTVGGKLLISVTQLLAEQGISADLSFVDPEHLHKLADKGSLIHQEIEDFVNNNNTDGFSDELEQFKKTVYPLANWKAETMTFYNDVYAGRVDLIGKTSDGKTIIADVKTGTVDKIAVRWQLSLYAYALYSNKQIDTPTPELMVVDLKSNYADCFKVEQIPQEEILKLIDCHRNNTKYSAPYLPISSEYEEKAVVLEQEIANLEKELKERKKQDEELKAFFKEQMEKTGLLKIKGQKVEITRTEYETTRLDTTAIKSELPEIYAKYSKKSTATRMTIKVI